MGFGFSTYRAQLRFTDDSKRAVNQVAGTVTVGRSVGRNWLLRVSLSGLLDGGVEAAGDVPAAAFGAGGSVAVSLARTWTWESGLLLGTTYSASMALARATYKGETEAQGFTAIDMRVGGLAGWTLAGRWTPYVAGRVYGGPVLWATSPGDAIAGGTDRYHVLIALGLSVRTPTGLYITAEWAPGGEQVLSCEVGATF